MIKRVFDFVSSTLAIIFLSPLLLIVGIIVRSDGGPAIYRQIRVGKDGKLFKLFKFRSMVVDADKLGAQVTASHDPRITRIGHFLRRTKLDELPQLFNVISGDISVVGPRPEVPGYVDQWPMEDREKILSLKPGITDYATLVYNDEQAVLAQSRDPEKTYIETVMPHKLTMYRRYIDDQGFLLDIMIIVATLLKIIGLKCALMMSKNNFPQDHLWKNNEIIMMEKETRITIAEAIRSIFIERRGRFDKKELICVLREMGLDAWERRSADTIDKRIGSVLCFLGKAELFWVRFSHGL
jgi:lipopolysaccharide/colanic/teichoic acid biosynthesis glycosyltransferase